MEHPFPSPLHHGSNTTLGGRLRALRNDDMFGHQNHQASTPGKMVPRVLRCSSPYPMPAQRETGLGLASYLALVKLVLLDKYDINSLSAEPS